MSGGNIGVDRRDADTSVSVQAVGHTDLWAGLPRPLSGMWVVAAAALLATLATLVGLALSHLLPQQSVALVYLLLVVLGAIGLGTWTGLTTALLSAMACNFFFIPPIYTFQISDPQELFALVVFFAVALLTGSVAGRMRETADSARHRASTLLSLNDFAARLSRATDQAAILEALAFQTAATVRGAAVVLIKDAEDLQQRASVPPDVQLESVEWQAAHRAWRSGAIAHASAPGWPGPQFEFRPLTTHLGTMGVIGLAPSDGQRAVAMENEAALQTVLRHAMIAIERTQLGIESAAARDEVERERIRSALLSSLSHDLRTPLASILGAVTSLRQLGANMPPAAQADLLAAIEEETGRLTRFVANLLDLTRLDTETPDLKSDWLDVADATQAAVARAKQLFPERELSLSAVAETPLVRGDAMLFEHVVFNLIDNAVKFSAPEQPIAVAVSAHDGAVVLTVTDQGRGIPPDQLQHVFEKFYRVRDGDRDIQGTGLGLTICERVVEGMDGTITAQSPTSSGKGTRMLVRLPIPATGSSVQLEHQEQITP
jgi:two-component system, OmpR family, sensor histidine kinase KdpD